jgi:hypothetical protein
LAFSQGGKCTPGNNTVAREPDGFARAATILDPATERQAEPLVQKYAGQTHFESHSKGCQGGQIDQQVGSRRLELA